MPETDLDARLDAVERALTDGETDLAELRDAAALADRVDELETRVAELESTVEELDAAVQAVRGYAGNVRAVNRDVERRASAALAKAEAIETALDEGAGTTAVPEDQTAHARDGRASGQPGEQRTGGPRAGGESGPETVPENSGPATRGSAAAPGSAPGAEAPGDRTDGSPAPRRDGRATCSEGGRSSPRDRSDPSSRTERPGAADTGREAGAPEGGPGQSGDGTSARTEQFIERVRDAL